MAAEKIAETLDDRTGWESGVVYHHTKAGCLEIGDSDRGPFLQRQTTNDLDALTPERSLVTVLTSATARILDVLRLIQTPETLLALTLPGHAAGTARFLQGKIFFMDKVTVADRSADFIQLDVEGESVGELLHRLGLPTPDIDQAQFTSINETQGWILGQRGLAGRGYRLLAPISGQATVENALESAGARRLTGESYNRLRIEAGLPAADHELTEDYTPLEVGLDWTISQNKGCYTGQEVIARQITYDKVTRNLVGLRMEASVEEGARVSSDGSAVGKVTSATVAPRRGPIALAVVKRPHHQPGTVVTVGEAEIPAQVVQLPFTSHQP